VIQTSSLNPNVNPIPETEPGYGQLFAVLIRRFPWFLAVFIASVGTAYYLTSRTAPEYKSSMQLQIEPNYQGKAEGAGAENKFTESSVQIDVATQLNLMKSSGLIEKAVKKLKPEYPDITVGEIKGSLVLKQLTGEKDVVTKIFQVDYTTTDPVKTKKVLDVIQKVYLEYNLQQQKQRLKKGLKNITEELNKVEKELRGYERNLKQFRSSNDFIDPEQQAKALEDNLNTIVQLRRETLSLHEETSARQKELVKQLNRNPESALVASRLSQSTRYQGLLNEIQKTELALGQERLRFTDETPSVQKLIEQLQTQKQLLQQEVGRTLGDSNATVSPVEDSLLQRGQLSQIDLNLAGQLAETQTNIRGLVARDQILIQKETDVRKELKRYPALLAEYNNLQPLILLNRQRLQDLLKSKQELRQELDKGGFNWEVVEKPEEGKRIGPNSQQNLLLGAVVGLMLGGIAAFLREASDDSVHTTAQLEKQVALPLLGTTPKLPPAKPRESVIKLPFGKPEVLAPWTIQVLQSPPRWESLDLIYKNIELVNSVATFKSLMITSALPDEGKSALALGLAMSAARLHKRVLLIDANLRDPSLHKQLNLPNEQGLSSLLASDVALPNQISIQSSSSFYIDILTAGPSPGDPANLLSSPRMMQLMAAFEENYDLVLIDASPVLGMVDAILTASSCRSVVMVASIGRVTRTQLTQATTMLSKLNLVGVVANGVSNSSSTYVPYIKPQRLALKEAVEK